VPSGAAEATGEFYRQWLGFQVPEPTNHLHAQQGGKRRRRRPKPSNQGQGESAKANKKYNTIENNGNAAPADADAATSSMLLTQTSFSPPATPPLEKYHNGESISSSALFLTEESESAAEEAHEGHEDAGHEDAESGSIGGGGSVGGDEDNAAGLLAHRVHRNITEGASPLENSLHFSLDGPLPPLSPPHSASASEGRGSNYGGEKTAVVGNASSSSNVVSRSSKSHYAQRPQPPGPWVTHLTNCDFYFTAPPLPLAAAPHKANAASFTSSRGEKPSLDEPLTPDGIRPVKTTTTTARGSGGYASGASGGNGVGSSATTTTTRHGLFICKGDTLMHIILRNPHVSRTPVADLDSNAQKKKPQPQPPIASSASKSSSTMPASTALAAESMLRARPAATTTLARVALEHGFDW